MTETGYLLTMHSLDINGRCELHYYGTGDSGPFVIAISPHKPVFFIRHDCPDQETAGLERKTLDLSDFDGVRVDGLYFSSLDSYFQTRRRLRDSNIRVYESDIRAEDRFLMERYIKCGVQIEGNVQKQNNINVFINPSLSPADYRPELRVMSLDIETGTDGSIYSIAEHTTYASGEFKTVLMRGEPANPVNAANRDSGNNYGSSQELRYLPDEQSLLLGFERHLQERDPDIIVGWHVIGFDLDFIKRRSELYGRPFTAGRGFRHRELRIFQKRSGMYSAEANGRIIIDGPQSLRTAFYKFENYKLETVAGELLGRGKDITPDEDKVAEIERRFREDKPALARYNLEDCVLVTEIFQKTAIIDQLVTRSLITGLPADKVHMSVASFDFFMLPLVHRKGLVAIDTADVMAGQHAAGGFVFTSAPGLYPHVIVLDFKSLYPTIIRTFFIDPVSRVRADVSPVTTPEGIRFSSTENVLPDFLEGLMDKRAEAKKNNDPYLSQAVKILMNSFYGVMGTTGCRFYHPYLPTAITGTGQWILKTCRAYLTDLGYEVIYGDTDSLFVCMKPEEQNRVDAAGAELAEQVNNHFINLMKSDFGIESKLEIEFEKHYTKFFLPPMRYTSEGARKRYAGMLEDGTIDFKGLETVRSDWTDLAKKFQQDLFFRFFNDMELAGWIKGFVEDLKTGSFDGLLIYKRQLNRKTSEYVKSTPPHVKAALKLDPDGSKNLRNVSYIMTAEGPTPVEMYSGGADYSHYIEKQIRPIADGVLFAAGRDFDSIIEGQQLDLF